MMDTEIFDLIEQENARTNDTLNLIASENYASKSILQVVGSGLANKYAEGYPGKRYYAGCDVVDEIEKIAIARAKQLFGAEHANVQPHSGSQANAAICLAMFGQGDTILSMDLNSGGHLTHGHPRNFSGMQYHFVHYEVSDNGELDYLKIEVKAKMIKPKCILAGASSYSKIIDYERIARIAQNCGALFWVDMAHVAGLIAAGLHPNPAPYADFVTSTTHKTLRGPRSGFILCKQKWANKIDSAVFPGIQGGPALNVIAGKAVCFYEAMQPAFIEYQRMVLENAVTLARELTTSGFEVIGGGTENHLVLVDLRSRTSLNGMQAQNILSQIGIIVNKNVIPKEPLSPFLASGIRLGTPALTTRGFLPRDISQLARIIAGVLTESILVEQAKAQVDTLCQKYPLF